MRYSLQLIYLYFRLGVLNELQYRTNFFTNLLQSAVGLATALGGLALVYGHTDSLAGWNASELLVLVGIYYVMLGLIDTMIRPSMELLLQDVRKGTLDFILTKPADAQLLVSIRRVSIWSLLDVLLGLGMIVVAMRQLSEPLTVAHLTGFVLTLLTGLVIVYSFWLMLATISFWFVKVENILVIFQSMYQAGRWPVNIYPFVLRMVLTFLVPVAFAVTVPAEMFVGRATVGSLLGAIGVAVVIFAAARWFWRFGVGHYSGASA